MTTFDIITASCAACGAIFLVPILLSILRSGSLQKKLYKYILVLVLFALAGCLIELVWALYVNVSGGAWPRALVYLDYADYVFGSVIRAAFALYVHAFLSMRINPSRIPLCIVLYLEAALVLLVSAALFFSLPGWLNDISRSMLLPFVSVALALTAPIRNIRILKTRELLSLLCYFFIPAACYFAEASFSGLWISYLGSSVGVTIMYVNIHLELNQRYAEQEVEMAENRISLMLSQIQPHFLYNSLSAIEDICDADIERAKTAINDFAHYLHGNLKSITQKKMLPFEEELEHVETYLSLEKLRFGERLHVVYEIEATDMNVPPLTVQPIAENAVRHGLMKKKEGGTVRIRAERSAGAHIITVEDDGVGFDPAAAPSGERIHVGIQNVRERLKALCSGTLEIESAPGFGTKCVITIPMASEAAK